MTKNHFQSHCSPFQINTQLFIFFFHKMDILDDRKSLSIAFLTISNQYTIFLNFGCQIIAKIDRDLPL